MAPRSIVGLAIATEGALAIGAWGLARILKLDVAWGHPHRDIAIGAVAALLLAAVNHTLLTRLPSSWIVNGVRAVYHELLLPVFGRLDTMAIVVIGVAAGLGEEWLFRGVLQPAIGWIAASVAFGLAHVGGRLMLPFGIWASAMGVALGSLAIATGGITAPVVAHGLYDMLALAYIRRAALERGMGQ
jgi:membrane protease YdiL (CAAX protease family)